jgi:hypothetical protein
MAYDRGLRVLVLTIVILAHAALAPGQPATDVKSLAGKWTGHGQSPAGTNPLEWTIDPDGAVHVVAATPTGTVTGKARVSVKDGRILYESGTSSGTLTLQGEGASRRLTYQGLSKRGNVPVGADLTPAK